MDLLMGRSLLHKEKNIINWNVAQKQKLDDVDLGKYLMTGLHKF